MSFSRKLLIPLLIIAATLLWGCDGKSTTPATPGDRPAQVTAAEEEPELIKLCAECHRKAGRVSVPFWPNTQGKSRAELVSLLRGYRDQRLTNAKMNEVTHSLTDENINQLADFYTRRN